MCDLSGWLDSAVAHELVPRGFGISIGNFMRDPLTTKARAASCWLRTVEIEVEDPVRSDSLDLDL